MAYPVNQDVLDLLSSAGITPAMTANVTVALAAAIAEIEHALNRSFTLTSSQARIFDGKGMPNLDIDPCNAPTLVELVSPDGVTATPYDATAWFPYPFNQTTKRCIRKVGHIWPFGMRNLRVTAQWGEALPDNVKLAMTYQAALYLLPSVSAAKSGGTKSWQTGGTEGTEREEYFEKPYMVAAEGWQRFIDRTLERERNWWL